MSPARPVYVSHRALSGARPKTLPFHERGQTTHEGTGESRSFVVRTACGIVAYAKHRERLAFVRADVAEAITRGRCERCGAHEIDA